MNRLKQIRYALLASIFSLLVCVSMFVGSTYAWLSDSASSAPHRIQAGNLKIELQKADGSGDYETVTDEMQIFDPDFLWEPGATQTVCFAVRNKGSLDAKFNILLTAKGGELAGRMEYVFLEDKKYGDLDEAEDWGRKQALAPVGAVVLKKEGSLKASGNEEGDCFYFALALHMKEGLQPKPIEEKMTFDLAINAVQLSGESDAFGSRGSEEAALQESHTYLLCSPETSGAVVSSAGEWNKVVREVGATAGAVKRVVFGRWNEQEDNDDLAGKTFEQGVELGAAGAESAAGVGDVRGFYAADSGALYILTDDPEGFLVVSDSMGNSEAGYFMGWTALREADLSCLLTGEAGFEVDSMGNLFSGCSNLEKIEFGSGFDTSKVTDMRGMFEGCESLTSLDLSGFDTKNATSMENMFNGCSGLTELDLTSFDTRRNVNIGGMFCGCEELETIYAKPAAGNRGFGVSSRQGENGENVFLNCHSINKNETSDLYVKYDPAWKENAPEVSYRRAYVGVQMNEVKVPGFFKPKP